MKPSNVVATPVSGVYKPPLTVKLDCPSVSVEPTSVATDLGTGNTYESRNISKVDNSLFFNAQGNLELDGKLGIYNINANTIANVSCPYNTVGASFIYVNGSVYIIGGNSPRHDNIMKYDTGTDTVTTLTQILPQVMMAMSCNAIGKYIYIIGGIE